MGASGDISPGLISRDYRIVRTSQENEVPVLEPCRRQVDHIPCAGRAPKLRRA